MSPDQERGLEEIFSAARDLPPREWLVFLERVCGDDANKLGLWQTSDQEPRTIWSKPAVLGSGRTGLPFMPLSMTFWLSRHSRKMSACTLFQVMLPALAFLLTGCIGVLPLPQLSNQPTHGTKLHAKDTAFIRVGTTPASELFGTLGTDCLCDPRQRAVAFSWELPGGRGVWWGCSTVGGGAAEFEWSRWRGLFVAFDANNVVTAANTKHLSSSKSLHEQLEAWARKHHAASDHIHPEMFVARNP